MINVYLSYNDSYVILSKFDPWTFKEGKTRNICDINMYKPKASKFSNNNILKLNMDEPRIKMRPPNDRIHIMYESDTKENKKHYHYILTKKHLALVHDFYTDAD